MSTSLEILTNAPVPIQTRENFEQILKELKALKMPKTSYWSHDGKTEIVGTKDWSYRLIESDESMPWVVEYDGDFMSCPTLTAGNCYLSSCYKYSFIFQNHQLDRFTDFRKEIYAMLKVFGGSEVIFLNDNGSCILGHYFDELVLRGNTYDEIKSIIQSEMGKPVTDYSLLNYDTLDYENINEYFPDDFRDLK